MFVVSVNDPFVYADTLDAMMERHCIDTCIRMKAWAESLDPEGKSGVRWITVCLG